MSDNLLDCPECGGNGQSINADGKLDGCLTCVRRGRAYPEIYDRVNAHQVAINELQPDYYGGKADPYEPFKVIRAWNLNFFMGNVLKYIRRAGLKDSKLVAYRKAREYLDSEIAELEKEEQTNV